LARAAQQLRGVTSHDENEFYVEDDEFYLDTNAKVIVGDNDSNPRICAGGWVTSSTMFRFFRTKGKMVFKYSTTTGFWDSRAFDMLPNRKCFVDMRSPVSRIVKKLLETIFTSREKGVLNVKDLAHMLGTSYVNLKMIAYLWLYISEITKDQESVFDCKMLSNRLVVKRCVNFGSLKGNIGANMSDGPGRLYPGLDVIAPFTESIFARLSHSEIEEQFPTKYGPKLIVYAEERRVIPLLSEIGLQSEQVYYVGRHMNAWDASPHFHVYLNERCGHDRVVFKSKFIELNTAVREFLSILMNKIRTCYRAGLVGNVLDRRDAKKGFEFIGKLYRQVPAQLRADFDIFFAADIYLTAHSNMSLSACQEMKKIESVGFTDEAMWQYLPGICTGIVGYDDLGGYILNNLDKVMLLPYTERLTPDFASLSSGLPVIDNFVDAASPELIRKHNTTHPQLEPMLELFSNCNRLYLSKVVKRELSRSSPIEKQSILPRELTEYVKIKKFLLQLRLHGDTGGYDRDQIMEIAGLILQEQKRCNV
jgi:hypothetical protein